MSKPIDMYLYKVTNNVSKTLLEFFEDDPDQELSAALFGVAAGVTIAKAFLSTPMSKQAFEATKKAIRKTIQAQLTTLNELEYRGES